MGQYGKSIRGVVSRLSDADARRQHAQYKPGGKLHMRWHPGSSPPGLLEGGAGAERMQDILRSMAGMAGSVHPGDIRALGIQRSKGVASGEERIRDLVNGTRHEGAAGKGYALYTPPAIGAPGTVLHSLNQLHKSYAGRRGYPGDLAQKAFEQERQWQEMRGR